MLAPLLAPLLCLEPALPTADPVISTLLLAAVIVPAPERRVFLVAQAEAITPTAAPSYLGAGD
jgi:hypothetical protein